jgi:Protein of unknown function (DUF4197)
MLDRRTLIVGAGLWGGAGLAQAQSLQDIIGAVRGSGATGGGPAAPGAGAILGAGLTQSDAASGLKEALRLGAIAATGRLGKLDGFFADGKVHIPLPGTLGKAQKSLKPLGLAGPLDDVELKMNRAAEQSMPAAKTLFVNAVSGITLTDALSILRGNETAATDYLRGKTAPDLTKFLRPKMEGTLQTTGAFTALDRASSSLNVGGMNLGGANLGANLKGQVIDFAVAKALDGAFYYVGQEEATIRKDPIKRTSAILKRVFGA